MAVAVIALRQSLRRSRSRWLRVPGRPGAAAWGLALTLGGGLALAGPPRHDAQRVTACPGVPVSVQATEPADAALACAGAVAAFAFMVPLGVTLPPEVRVELVPELPPDLRADAVGCYAMESRRTFVLTRERFRARGNWFSLPTSDALYQSVVAHEVAHAIVGCHIGGRKLPTAAHEYVAYVVMFSTMDPAERQAALQVNPGQGYDHDAQINDLQYAFDPMRFGVEAYRHWLRQRDGADFLRRVLAGQVVSELLFN